MKITIDTDVLNREHLTMGEYLVLLLGFYDVDYQRCCSSLCKKDKASTNVFDNTSIVLSDNSRNLVAKILVESSDKVIDSSIDFEGLATKLQAIYPEGNKPGTTYSWRGTVEEIAQKLRTLVALYGFTFTEEEALRATDEYVKSYDKAEKHRRLLKYFILKTNSGDISSMFMTIIENNRNESNIR